MLSHLCQRYNTCITAKLFHCFGVSCLAYAWTCVYVLGSQRPGVWAVPCVVCNLCISYAYWVWWKPRGTLVDNKSIFYRENQTNGWLKTPESMALLWSPFTVRRAQLSEGMREMACEPLDYGEFWENDSAEVGTQRRAHKRRKCIWSTEQHHVKGGLSKSTVL